MRKRIVKGDEALQKIEGFRMFIKKAKKKELEWLLKENPTYFEDTLAYAVAFGLVEKYAKKFEGLVSTSPEWYSSTSGHLHMAGFSNSFNSAMQSASASFVSRPSSSSGSGGSFGGGSSGGGFGGGGGGHFLKSISFEMVFRISVIGTRCCSMESRWRMVTVWSSLVWWSTVMQKGVPAASCRR